MKTSFRLLVAVVALLWMAPMAYHHAFGMADREAATAMQTDTIFRIASMSKAITRPWWNSALA